MPLLVLLRHGQSQWNLENRFTGWWDVDLSPKGIEEARAAGALMRDKGLAFDRCFTSVLTRAIRTLHLALHEMDQLWLPVAKDWHLNERHYGALTGLDKQEMVDQVAIFFLAFVPQFIAPDAGNKALAFVLLGLIFNLNAIPVNSGWALAAAWLARRGAVQRGMHWLDRAAAAMFIGFGLKLALSDNPTAP
jgi:hypothetical protein